MKEKEIEHKLVQSVQAAGGIATKLICPGCGGMPDRIVLFPEGRIAFVEVKAHGMKPRALQLRRHGMLRRLGFKVYILDDTEQIGGMLREIQSS